MPRPGPHATQPGAKCWLSRPSCKCPSGHPAEPSPASELLLPLAALASEPHGPTPTRDPGMAATPCACQVQVCGRPSGWRC